MNHFHPINSIDDETELLSKIIHLETQIRAKRERERLFRTGQNETYTRIFEPITRELKTLKQLETVNQTPPPAAPTPVNTPVKPPSIKSDPATPRNLFPADEDTTPNETVETTPEPRSTPETPPSPAYSTTVGKIRAANKEDGSLGLNSTTNLVNGNPYIVEGNTLKVIQNGETKTFKIKHPLTWAMLLAKNPTKCTPPLTYTNSITKKYLPHVIEYRKIGHKLNFANYCESTVQGNYKVRNKYKLLKETGRGFLFSVKPPSHVAIIPSDPQGVLRELQKAIAEYKAGNRSMRNIIAPLAQQAKRMKILPKNFSKEFNWIYA